MKYRKLGSSSLEISEISFGCMSLEKDQIQNTKLIHTALNQGINFFDTADLYEKGQNEVRVGTALKDNRQEIILATKVGNEWKPDGSGWDWNPSKSYILKAVENSLRRLQTDYIDLYQLHGGTIEDPMDEIIEAFELLKQQGKIRYYGISSIRPNVIREWVDRSNITSVMMQYSILDRRPEEACLELLQENNTGVLARGTLAKGLLAGKSAKAYLHYSQKEVRIILENIKQIIGDTDRSLYETALGYVLNNQAISSSVVGIRTQDQVVDLFKNYSSLDLAKFSMELLKNEIPAARYIKHR